MKNFIYALGLLCALNTDLYCGIKTRELNMTSATINVEDIEAESGTIKTKSGRLGVVAVQKDLTLDVEESFLLVDATIGGTLIIKGGCLVELANVQAEKLIIENAARVYIYDTCNIKRVVAKDSEAIVYDVKKRK